MKTSRTLLAALLFVPLLTWANESVRLATFDVDATPPLGAPMAYGAAHVREVASQRRIPGPDGRIRATRTSSTRDPAIRAEPEGGIDPVVSLRSFWNGEHPLAMLSYYACQARVLHLPGELFVECQLAAKEMRPDRHVMMTAYGDYGPGYIGTVRADEEGGFETQPTSSNVAPDVEAVLQAAMKKHLNGASL